MALCPRSASIAILCSTALVAAIFYAYNNNNNESILNDPNKRWLAAVSSFTDPRKVTPRFRNPVRKHLPIEHIPALQPGIVYEGHAQTIGLEQKLDTFFANRSEEGGFFIESGAYNGIDHSNTLWLERERNWKGLLVEGNPNMPNLVCKSGRHRSYLADCCLAAGQAIVQLGFRMAGPLGGLTSNMDAKQARRIYNGMKKHKDDMNEENVGSTVMVTCYPLNDLLKGLDQEVVDFWSLDVEGGEIPILKSVDVSAVMFGLIFIESNTRPHYEEVRAFMTSVGFVENMELKGAQDSAWQNPYYCDKYKGACNL